MGCCKKILLTITLVALAAVSPCIVFAQTVIMPVTGHGDTTMSYVVLYDDGGASQPYSNQCNATYTFHTVHPNGRYIIDVESYLTHPQGNASLQITNGLNVYGQSICSCPSNGSGGRFFSNSNAVTIGFVADDDMPTAGFKVILCEYTNSVASNVSVGFVDSNTYYIRWNGCDDTTMWTFQYGIVYEAVDLDSYFDTASNTTTVMLDTCYFEIHDIPVGMHVVYQFVTPQGDAPCVRLVNGQGVPYSEPDVCPCVKPDSAQVVEMPDSLRVIWYGSDTVSRWHIWYQTLFIDTILDGSVRSFTIPYTYPCQGDILMINGGCTRACEIYYLYLPAGGCHLGVGSIRRMATTGSSITLEWNPVQDSAARQLFYYRVCGYDNQFTFYDTLPAWTGGLTLEGLLPVTEYEFRIDVLCPDGHLSCTPSRAYYSTTLDNCIDFVNIYDHDKVHLTWGSYSDPMRNGSGGQGRHVPIVDTTLFDNNTGNALRCVPHGEVASFRLGDNNVGALAETVTYDYDVDSLDKDMLVLKYAVVLQNSNHNSQNQPHFTLEILDDNGNVIDTTCCYADFYAAGDLGWNSVAGTNIIWKDWTTIGIDIARYHGQRIKIRFTTKDCSDGGHFGYAYFTIGCDSKRIALVNLCETADSVRLRVPLGFEYRWTRGDDTTVISTENEIFVPADSSEYHCHASFVGKPECSFEVRSFAVLPKARAEMRVDFDTCHNMAYLVSRCHVEIDSTLLPYVRQTIDSIQWHIGNEVYYGDTLAMPISGNGSYPVRLFCKLSDSQCIDSVDYEVIVNFFHSADILGDSLACEGDTLLLCGHVSPFSEVAVAWDNGSRDTLRTLVVDKDTMVTLYVNYYSCFDTLHHHVSVNPNYDDSVSAAFCSGLCDTLGFSETETGIYTHVAHSIYGCDSLMTLNLTIFPTYHDTTRFVSCDEPYHDNEFDEDSTGFYANAYLTVDGCDSILCLDFVRHPLFVDTVVDEIYHGDIFDDYGFNERETGFYEMVYQDQYGCDSIWRLDLRVAYLRFPNVVTPNGDGYNDLLEIVGLLETTMFDYNCLWVFDRWGRRIYKKENIRQTSDFWNPSKTDTPDGTYFYRFHASGVKKEVNYKGVVEVVR